MYLLHPLELKELQVRVAPPNGSASVYPQAAQRCLAAARPCAASTLGCSNAPYSYASLTVPS